MWRITVPGDGGMTQVVSIFERLGSGGGGKVRAVLTRMNAFAGMADMDAVLLNLDHNPKQRVLFAELQADGAISPELRMVTLPEFCRDAALAAGIKPFDGFPGFDERRGKADRIVYRHGGERVMEDRLSDTAAGEMTKRRIANDPRRRVFTLLNGRLEQMVQRNPDGTVETTDYTDGLPIRWTKTRGREFQIGRNLVTDTICRMPRIYAQNIYQMINWQDALVFFDGVTSAYLSPVTTARRALFLHADHRGPKGGVVPRSRYLIENFNGEAIVTSTEVHKARMKEDLTPAAPVHVIPHCCDPAEPHERTRQNLVTVSRLDLVGKPIDECIAAFATVMNDFPEVDYLIYGVGAGEAALREQIAALGCEDRIRLLGYTTEPAAVFQGALASVYPTTTEGFGLSILEALANGCPVITYDVDYGPRELIAPGINGELVARGDLDAIADAMRRVLSAAGHYQKGTSKGLDRYTRAAYRENYRNLVLGLMQECSGSSGVRSAGDKAAN